MSKRWVFCPPAAGVLPRELLRDPEGYIEGCGEVISRGRRHLTAICDGYFVKLYRLPTAERLKALFRATKAEREWKGSKRLWEAGVAVPEPLAWGRDGLLGGACVYVAQALQGARAMGELDGEELEGLLPEAARAIKAMHDVGVFHKDLHGGNVLVKGEMVYLTDLHRHRHHIGGVPLRERCWDVASFLHSLKGRLSSGGRQVFLREYFGAIVPPLLQKAERKVFLRHLEHIRRDCVEDSLAFHRVSLRGLKGWATRWLSPQALDAILDKHMRVLKGQGEEVKKVGRRSSVTLFAHEGKRICVKEYRFGPLSGLKERLRLPKPRRAWINANLSFGMGIGEMRPLAYLERWGWGLEEAYLVILSPQHYMEMSNYLRKLKSGKERRRFLEAFASFLKELYERGLWHRDLKAHHVMVAETAKGWDFTLIEPEDLRFIKVKDRHLFRNLIQLNNTLPSFVDWRLKLRFLKKFLGHKDLRTIFSSKVNVKS